MKSKSVFTLLVFAAAPAGQLEAYKDNADVMEAQADRFVAE